MLLMSFIGAISSGLTLFRIGVTRLCCARTPPISNDPLRVHTVWRNQNDGLVASVNPTNNLIRNNIASLQILLVQPTVHTKRLNLLGHRSSDPSIKRRVANEHYISRAFLPFGGFRHLSTRLTSHTSPEYPLIIAWAMRQSFTAPARSSILYRSSAPASPPTDLS